MVQQGKFDAFLLFLGSQVPERIALFIEYLVLKHINFKEIEMLNEINGSNPFRTTIEPEDEINILIFFFMSLFMKLGRTKVHHLEAKTTVVNFPKPAETEVLDEFFADLLKEIMTNVNQ